MLINPIIDQLKKMKLTGMAEALNEQLQTPSTNDLNFEQRLGLLVDREKDIRMTRLLQTRLRQARLHFTQACVEDINYDSKRQLDKKQIAELATGNWLRQKQNLIFTGATGTGKSWIACAIAHKACMLGYRVQYWRVSRLLEELNLASADGRYLTLIKNLAKIDLLVLDDWGMVKIKGQQQQHMLDILDDRYQKRSTLITSQLPISKWYEQVIDETFADAILDRLLGQAQVMSISGPSMRTQKEVSNKKKD